MKNLQVQFFPFKLLVLVQKIRFAFSLVSRKSRLLKLSIKSLGLESRTPSSGPNWGWNRQEGTKILQTKLTGIKLNSAKVKNQLVPSLGFCSCPHWALHFQVFFSSSLSWKAMLKTCHTQPFPHTSYGHILQAVSFYFFSPHFSSFFEFKSFWL
jgi:hypothetical protein